MVKFKVGNITIRLSGIFAAIFILVALICIFSILHAGFDPEKSLKEAFGSESFLEDRYYRLPVLARNIKHEPDIADTNINDISFEYGHYYYGNLRLDSRVTNIPDTRPLMCKYKVYDPTKYEIGSKNVSVVLVYNDYEFYELKKTVESILMSNSMKIITEIIVVDDSSALEYIQEEAAKFFSSVPKARIFKSSLKEPMGLGRARNLAAKSSTGDKLIFISSSVVVGNGWLEPLIKQIEDYPEVIAVPHIDHLKDPVSMDYMITPEDHTYTVTWSLAIRPFKMVAPETVGDLLSTPLNTDAPAMKGYIFAISRDLFVKLNGYDSTLEEYGGGEHVDLSLKAWLCGSGITTVHCSRVAAVNSRDPQKVKSEFNRKRLTDAWFSEEEYRSSIYRLLGISLDDGGDDYKDMEYADKSLATYFSSFMMGQKSKCVRNIKWYVDNVAVNMVPVMKEAITYGILRTGTNRCAHLLTVDNPINNQSNIDPFLVKIKLDECKPTVVQDPRLSVRNNKNGIRNLPHESEFVFQLTKDGLIVVDGGFCVAAKENGYLVVERCTGSDKQRFRYQNGQLINVWCGYCAMQVTDPNPSTPGDKQIAMVQSCDSYSDQEKSFKIWTFVNL